MHFGELLFKYLPSRGAGYVPEDFYEEAYARLARAVKDGDISISIIDESDVEKAAMLFVAERTILASASNPYLTRRVAIAYAKAMHYMLKEQELEETARFLGIDFSKGNDSSNSVYLMHVSTYLKFMPKSQDYKLFYVGLSDGYVELPKKKFFRLVEEAIKSKLEVQPRTDDKRATYYANMLKEHIPKPKVTITGEKPPCIRSLLDDMARHENLSHYARWTLGVYLIKSGMPLENIVKLYSNLPDFDPKITTYQLKHIMEKGYSVPSCEKMQVYGLRKPDCPCLKDPRLKSPAFYKGKK
ncbi:MAG: hypothetical protein D6769_03450 [Methanobacteriota archaeon]|nr:MAG: hypothetical protein D6769_03450 [Euryarchaeota archaeon]